VDISEFKTEFENHSGSTANPHQVTLEQVRSQDNQINGEIDFNQNQAQNLTIENATIAPVSPVEGQIYYNTNDNKAYIWDGTNWLDMISNTSTG